MLASDFLDYKIALAHFVAQAAQGHFTAGVGERENVFQAVRPVKVYHPNHPFTACHTSHRAPTAAPATNIPRQ